MDGPPDDALPAGDTGGATTRRAEPVDDADAPLDDGAPGDAVLVRARLLDAAPEAVRARVAELVSTAVGRIPVPDLPAPVRPVARFAPAKRARAGSGPMLAAVTGADGFADQVVAWWREHAPREWSAHGDDVTAAATALLEGRDDGAALVRDVGERADAWRLRAERDAATARADKLTAELARVSAERDEARRAAAEATEADRDEVVKLRARLRDQGVRVRRAEDDAAAARAAHEAGDGDLRRELADARRERDRLRDAAAAAENRARRAGDELTAARRAAREARHADDARLALLVDTVAGAAAGLRRELGLRTDALGEAGPGARPAELVGTRECTKIDLIHRCIHS